MFRNLYSICYLHTINMSTALTMQKATRLLTNSTTLTAQEAAHVLANLKNFVHYLETWPPTECEVREGVPIDFRVKKHVRKDGTTYKT